MQPDYGTGEKKLSVYIFGLFLCVVLTLIPFGAVMYPDLSDAKTFIVIMVSATLQFLVQVVCFLRLNYSTEQAKMNVMSFILSIFILFVVVAGSLWIMYTLNYRMMH
tara:strand:+ start:9378 stop:9698 length:321 start_codon:yes stop_codon:yes gene_type:complete